MKASVSYTSTNCTTPRLCSIFACRSFISVCGVCVTPAHYDRDLVGNSVVMMHERRFKEPSFSHHGRVPDYHEIVLRRAQTPDRHCDRIPPTRCPDHPQT